MRDFPHENLPTEQLSLSEFTYCMKQASVTEDPMNFIDVALCGRINEDQRLRRVLLNARQNLDHPHHPLFTRDFDSAIGITLNFPFTAALNVYPVPNFRDTLTRPNHVQGPIYHDNNNVGAFISLIVSSRLLVAVDRRILYNMYHSATSQTVVLALLNIVTSLGSSFHAYTIQRRQMLS